MFSLRFGPMRGYFVNHTDYVCKVLAARSKSFRKPSVVQRALVDILGENIFTSNGAAWKQRRQALQPAFHLRHVERYTQIMLVFTWLALMQNPDVADRLYAEVEDVLGHRPLCLADLKSLKYSERVTKEALRLYPSAWGFSRSTLEPVQIGGTVLSRNSMVMVSPWTLGRDPRWFPHPNQFDPDRFLPENAKSIPRYAYLPFGDGARTCLGSHFALMEAVIINTSIAQRFRLLPQQDSATGPKSAAFTLRPNGNMRVKIGDK